VSESGAQLEGLSELQRRVITALCQAGGRRVGRALRDLLGAHTQHIEIYDAGVLELTAALELLDSGQEHLIGILFDLSGSDSGSLSMLLPERGALLLAGRLLMGQPVLDSEGALTADASSAMVEVGNIVASAFLNAIADAVHRACLPSPPSLVHDSQPALTRKLEAGLRSPSVLAISFEALLKDHREPLRGGIFFAPDSQFLGAKLGS
jgi:chemotaxis protein CheC